MLQTRFKHDVLTVTYSSVHCTSVLKKKNYFTWQPCLNFAVYRATCSLIHRIRCSSCFNINVYKLTCSIFLLILRYLCRSSLLKEFNTLPSTRFISSVSASWGDQYHLAMSWPPKCDVVYQLVGTCYSNKYHHNHSVFNV